MKYSADFSSVSPNSIAVSPGELTKGVSSQSLQPLTSRSQQLPVESHVESRRVMIHPSSTGAVQHAALLFSLLRTAMREVTYALHMHSQNMELMARMRTMVTMVTWSYPLKDAKQHAISPCHTCRFPIRCQTGPTDRALEPQRS